MQEPVFIILDTNSRSIQKDRNGMLCIFDTKPEADRYYRSLNAASKARVKVVGRLQEFRPS